METRRIGSLDVSVVGLGCNNFGNRIDDERTREVIEAALEAGITLFDTADVYGGGRSEELIGEWIAGRRDRVVIATKFGMPLDEERQGASPEHVRRACEDSLRRLRTDHIDLYQLHRPDPQVPVEETLGALGELVEAGKVREIGHSNLSGAQIEAAEQAAGNGPRFVCAQNRWSLLDREAEAEVLPAVERNGLAFLPFYPLASGLLTGKYRADREPEPSWRIARQPAERRAEQLSQERLRRMEVLRGFAEERGHNLLELAFSWLASHGVVASVIAGATRAEQIQSNVDALGWRLEPDELREIDRITGAGPAG